MAKKLLLASALVALASSALADEVSYTATVPTTRTNFTTSVNLPGFDPALGTLTGVSLILTATVLGDASFESIDATPATVNVNLGATATATAPGALTVTTVPLANTTVNVAAFDGTVDFGGASGRTFSDLTNTATNSSSTFSGFESYLGVATVPVGLTAVGSSTASGPGNLASLFRTDANAVVGITYTYDPVPEPAALASLAVGAVALIRRRRRN